MATDIEEFESGVMLVCDAHKDLSSVNPNNPLLSLIELTGRGFRPTREYNRRYVTPHLRSPSGQLCLWDWAYPNQIEAKMHGLLEYYQNLFGVIRTEISNRDFEGLSKKYS